MFTKTWAFLHIFVRIGQNFCKINENFALSYTFPTCMKPIFLSSVNCAHAFLFTQVLSKIRKHHHKQINKRWVILHSCNIISLPTKNLTRQINERMYVLIMGLIIMLCSKVTLITCTSTTEIHKLYVHVLYIAEKC